MKAFEELDGGGDYDGGVPVLGGELRAVVLGGGVEGAVVFDDK